MCLDKRGNNGKLNHKHVLISRTLLRLPWINSLVHASAVPMDRSHDITLATVRSSCRNLAEWGGGWMEE